MREEQVTDFRPLCRDVDKIYTRIVIRLDWEKGLAFELGQISTRFHSTLKYWEVGAYLGEATDFEHDSAWAFKLGVIGLTFEDVSYGRTALTGWVQPELENFRIPPADYDPRALKKATKCKQCKKGDAHVMVPEGFYVPKENPDLFKLCAGKPIEITTGVCVHGR